MIFCNDDNEFIEIILITVFWFHEGILLNSKQLLEIRLFARKVIVTLVKKGTCYVVYLFIQSFH